MKIEHKECPETSAYKMQTPGNNPEENIQHSEHGESLKLRIISFFKGIYSMDVVSFHAWKIVEG